MRYKHINSGLVFLFSLTLTLPALVASGQRLDTLIIHFNSNESRILPEDSAAMDRLLKSRSRLVSVALYGHTDYVGNDRYNDSLSRERVRAARAWLLAWGLRDSVFHDAGDFGRRRPLNDNGTDQKRSLNRRVEIVFNSILPPARPKSALEAEFHDTAHLTGRKNIVLQNVNFYGDRHFPLPGSYPVLQQLGNVLQRNPDIRIEIQGYVCCNGPDKDGYDRDTHTPDLSIQRAKYIYRYLIGLGIDSTRMTYRGFGASHPIYPREENEDERTANRRVELKILQR